MQEGIPQGNLLSHPAPQDCSTPKPLFASPWKGQMLSTCVAITRARREAAENPHATAPHPLAFKPAEANTSGSK